MTFIIILLKNILWHSWGHIENILMKLFPYFCQHFSDSFNEIVYFIFISVFMTFPVIFLIIFLPYLYGLFYHGFLWFLGHFLQRKEILRIFNCWVLNYCLAFSNIFQNWHARIYWKNNNFHATEYKKWPRYIIMIIMMLSIGCFLFC